ncbi:MAG: hypothetical protein ACLS6O_00590 [Bifidobacterium sp.]
MFHVWDKDGSHYGGPAGYSLYVGGKLAFTSDKLAHSSMTRLRERSRSRTIPVPRLPSAPKPSRT